MKEEQAIKPDHMGIVGKLDMNLTLKAPEKEWSIFSRCEVSTASDAVKRTESREADW